MSGGGAATARATTVDERRSAQRRPARGGIMRTQLSGAARRPARLLLTGLAVLVASFVVYATVLAQQITERSVLNNLSGTPATVDLVASQGAVTTGQLARIRALPGVAEAAGRIEAGGDVGGQYLSVAADPGAGPLATVTVTSGRYPAKPGEIAVTPRTADRLGLPVGTTVPVVTRWTEDGRPGKPVPLTVTGLVEARDDFGANGYAAQPAVTALLGEPALQQIDVRLDGSAAPDTVRAGMEAILAAGAPATADDPRAVVVTGDEIRRTEAEEAADEITELFAVVGMFVAVAVVAAGLVATSTFRIVFAQRLRQLALLRAVGAGRGALTRSLAAEGALTGLVAGVVGVLAALGAGHLLPVVARAFGPDLESPGVPLLPAAGVVLLAVVITVLAVLAPAVSAARVAPLEALRAAGTTGARRDIGVLRWVLGLLLTAGAAGIAGLVVTRLPGRDEQNYDPMPMLLAVVGSGALAFFALVALGPALVRPVLAVVGWPLRRLGPTGRLAVGGMGGAPRRAAAVSVVVALGVTLIAGVLVAGASGRVLVEREAATTVPADFELTASAEARLDTGLVEQIRGRGELAHVTPYRRLDGVTVGADAAELTANDLDMTAVPQLSKLDVASGSWRDAGPGEVVLSGYVAEIAGLRAGDRTEVRAGGRVVPVTVAAVLPGSVPLASSLVLDPADLTRLGAPADRYSGVLADAARDGEQARTEGQRALRQVVGARPGLGIAVLADQRDEIDQVLTVVLLVAVGLISLTVIIAVVGVGTTTALSVVERVRESGLLRAVGLSRAGLGAMLTAEAGLYGVVGATLGLLLGVPYAWLAVKALGVNAPLALPGWQLVAVFAALVLFTALAGVLPARRAARVSPVAALGTDG
jgi:putative ABC transport system permease protein